MIDFNQYKQFFFKDNDSIFDRIHKEDRVLKQKQECTIDYCYNWWIWTIKFSKKESYFRETVFKEYIIHNGTRYYINTFENFCDFIKRYRNVRIV